MIENHTRWGRSLVTTITLGGSMLALFCACGIAGTTTTNLIVDFNNAQDSAARDEVRARCGTLPGIGVVPPRSKDVSVYFDIQHATNIQVNALSTCINDAQTQDSGLGIRGYRITDGSGS